MGELRSAVDALVAAGLAEFDDAALGDLLVEVARQQDRLEAVCLSVWSTTRSEPMALVRTSRDIECIFNIEYPCDREGISECRANRATSRRAAPR